MPFEPTPNPSIEELMALDGLVNGDLGAAQDEIVSRLRQLLNGAIAAKNAKSGWTGHRAMLPIKNPARDIDFAPAVLSDTAIGKVLVSVSVETKTSGAGAFKNEVQVVISHIEGRIQTSQQVRANWKFAEAVRLCLFPFLNGVVSDEGFVCWAQLEPTGFSLLSSDWAKGYNGTQTMFRLTQAPHI